MTALTTVGYFLFSLFFSLLTFILWARMALRYFRISSLHPMSQVIYKLTDPLVNLISRIFPKSSRLTRYDWPCLATLVLVELVKFILISLLFLNTMMPPMLLVLYVLASLILQPLNLLFYAIIIRVIMSWINPGWIHPAAGLLRTVTEPSLQFGRRIVPDISGFDFSPILILIILQVVTLFIRALLPLPLI